MQPLSERLHDARPLVLDGATGTELERRGVDVGLPLWSARALIDAPDVLRQIHRDYVAAGADALTACTFRTHRHNLAAAGMADRAAELTELAVRLAREAAAGRAWVLGSQAPLEDCYHPERTPPDDVLRREHRAMARNLLATGVDGILVETQNSIREAVAATSAAAETDLPVLVSFICGADGRLLSGESLGEAVAAVKPFGPAALLVNCLPADTATDTVRHLHKVAGGVPIGIYANTGRADADGNWTDTAATDPHVYAEYASQWLEAGATFIGGCCGTTPEHVRRLRALIER